ncbi:MAG: prepilin-type N-terminal cleavage/methylation domain-containing protein [Candidatus Rifleibacteriota bacterium]
MKQNKKGFTLLELLVVVGILAALVALALPFYQDYVNQSKLTAAQTDLQTFKKALTMYDQMERTPFTGNDLRLLVGRYLQDFRVTATQQRPNDPWGVEYRFETLAGTVTSGGPDGTITTAATAREPAGDDILVTWKPVFFVSGARAINQNIVEISFSRMVNTTTVAAADFTINNGIGNPSSVQKISNTVFRLITANMTAGTTYTLTITDASITALDGKAIAAADLKPDNTTTANVISFVF